MDGDTNSWCRVVTGVRQGCMHSITTAVCNCDGLGATQDHGQQCWTHHVGRTTSLARHNTMGALPIHFFRHFCCRIYHSATTQRNTEPVWNSHGGRGHVTMNAIPDAAFRRFGSASIYRTSHAVRSAFLALAALHVLLVSSTIPKLQFSDIVVVRSGSREYIYDSPTG